ncbi:MAG TPA: transglycosylase SLT domain-containing protein [Candidatus Acidoferrales bacterium]|nr:transglycosylase SLT domain-containing protein [Candidatus Acidoferrales bacterium]
MAVQAERGNRLAAGPGPRLKQRRRRSRRRRGGWQIWLRSGVEVIALLTGALIGVIALLGRLADWFAGAGWSHLLPFAGAVLGFGVAMAIALRVWLSTRGWLARKHLPLLPPIIAIAIAAAAVWFARQPEFDHEVISLRTLVGGEAEAERVAIAHQVYAAYRRSDLTQLLRILERARVYEPTVHEAAAAFGVDAEVLMGVGAAESSFYPRDSADGGRGLFQITAPPQVAVTLARRQLGIDRLDPLNQRHNAFLAAATFSHYLAEMRGDLFLGLLAYNIGPSNGGLRSIMTQYGARDFVTIQPYLQHLPRDYPIRVLSAALAYRLWRTEGRLPRYEDGDNAMHIQSVGVPGLQPESPRLTASPG